MLVDGLGAPIETFLGMKDPFGFAGGSAGGKEAPFELRVGLRELPSLLDEMRRGGELGHDDRLTLGRRFGKKGAAFEGRFCGTCLPKLEGDGNHDLILNGMAQAIAGGSEAILFNRLEGGGIKTAVTGARDEPWGADFSLGGDGDLNLGGALLSASARGGGIAGSACFLDRSSRGNAA